MKKYDIYREERAKGLSYKEIADKYGVSKQNVAIACGKSQKWNFRYWTATGCIYPNVRKWLNENQITTRELIHRLGIDYHNTTCARIRSYLIGHCYPPKMIIDKFLSVTGLTYEEFFETEKGGAEE